MKRYENPNAQIKNFASEDVITTSGTVVNNPLNKVALKTFNVADAAVVVCGIILVISFLITIKKESEDA